MTTILFSLLCAILWGYAELYYKRNTNNCSVLTILVYRYIFQILIYITLILIVDIDAFNRFDISIYKFLLPLFFSATILGHLLYTLAIKHENLSIVSPIMASDPVYIILIGLLLFNEDISIYAIILLFVICFSVFALNFVNSGGTKKVKKIALFLASLYAFATAFSTTFEKSAYLSGYKVTDIYFHYIFLLIIYLIIALIYMKIKKMRLEKFDKNLLLGLTFNQSGYILYSYLISSAYISLVAPITGLYSVVTYVLATKILKEKLTSKQNICIFLIIVSTILLLIINS